MSGVTQIPASGFVANAEFTPMDAPAAVTASAPVETARPVEPVNDTGNQQPSYSRNFLVHAMAFSAIATMVGKATATADGTRASDASMAAPAESADQRDTGSAILDLSARFLAALAASRDGTQDASARDALFTAPGPSPSPLPTLPADVPTLGALVRRQILQDYRVAFMVHGRLTVAVAQLLL